MYWLSPDFGSCHRWSGGFFCGPVDQLNGSGARGNRLGPLHALIMSLLQASDRLCGASYCRLPTELREAVESAVEQLRFRVTVSMQSTHAEHAGILVSTPRGESYAVVMNPVTGWLRQNETMKRGS